MQFVSLAFVLFFIVVFVGYYLCPGKYQYIFLAIVNLVYFYFLVRNSPGLILVPIVIIIVSYVGGLILLKHKNGLALFGSIACTGSFLLFFKYTHFFQKTFSFVSGIQWRTMQLIVPIGISFYTLCALGYVIDVYKGKCLAENNPVRLAAFILFFPTVTSGPIERTSGLLRQLRLSEGRKISYDNVTRGAMIFIYGVFIKLVVADRLSVVVNTVYDNIYAYGGGILYLASIAYTMQIYCDFASYSLLALGGGKMLGFDLIDNFRSPYLAESVREFWRRWHISLSEWFRDYVYIPLGGNRCFRLRRDLNLLLTFLVSGLWHGADWSFAVWGGCHGAFQITGNLTENIRGKLVRITGLNTDCFSFHFWRKFFTFQCISFAWIFFRADSIKNAVAYIDRMITEPRLWELSNGLVFDLGLDQFNNCILWISLIIIIILDVVKYKTGRNIDAVLNDQNAWFRIAVIIFFIAMSFVYGQYGMEFDSQEFIYVQF